jgi:mono/diheme cytochrome c family protein
MRLTAGFAVAIAAIVVTVILVITTGLYNVVATVPHTFLERLILSNIMLYQLAYIPARRWQKTWTEDQLRDGFREYDEMCVCCHGAAGKEASDIGKGLNPPPPNLAEASERWTNAELFWIVKNGIKMTGMPAFAPTHQDAQIWNIVGLFVASPVCQPNSMRI